jgi:hypothetical protein
MVSCSTALWLRDPSSTPSQVREGPNEGIGVLIAEKVSGFSQSED